MFHQNLQLSKLCLAKIKQYPKFYQELIQIWANASEKEPSRKSEICEKVLWNNKVITSNGDSLFNKHFILKGIMTMRGIIDEYGVRAIIHFTPIAKVFKTVIKNVDAFFL